MCGFWHEGNGYKSHETWNKCFVFLKTFVDDVNVHNNTSCQQDLEHLTCVVIRLNEINFKLNFQFHDFVFNVKMFLDPIRY